MDYISNICIDLGGKNTGVLLTHGKKEDLPEEHERLGVVMSYPDAGLNLSLKDRLANRHHRRALKRKKLAKRFLALILKQFYGGKNFEEDFTLLRTFLNRRGYTYLTLEELQDAETILKECSPTITEILDGLTQGKIKAGFSLWNQLARKIEQKDDDFFIQISKDIQKAKKSSDDIKTIVENYEVDIKELKKILTALDDYVNSILKAKFSGHKHRKQYLEEIRLDLKTDAFKDLVKKFKLNSDELFNLIGHVANLQLRVLRKYFNSKNFQKEDFWDEKRFQKIFIKYLRSWHTGDETYKKNRKYLLEKVQKNGVLKTFREVHPEHSIPPLEEQNNRRPFRCHSLHLDAHALDKAYPKWKEWLEKILNHCENRYELDKNTSQVQEIYEYYKKASTPHKKVKSKEAILLQRILDRNQALDLFCLRTLVKVKNWKEETKPPEKLINRYETGYRELKSVLGKDADKFIELAGRYYTEVERAKRGLWLPEEENNLLFVCSAKPKLKKNSKKILIGAILGVSFSEPEFNKWKEFYENEKIDLEKGKQIKISKIFREIEEERKKSPEEFFIYWNLHKKDFKSLEKIQLKTQESSERDFIKILDLVKSVCVKIQEFFKHTKKQKERYENPYSLAQIYNIMEGDLGGFHRTCPACTLENEWRSFNSLEAPNIEVDKSFARAVRLPADTMRPFDGMIAKYLERVAVKIANLKIKQLENFIEKNSVTNKDMVYVNILLEENRFKFQADLAEVKRSRYLKKFKERFAKSEQKLLSKRERIIRASKGICPYTGKTLEKDGQIDHILPRSYSKSSYGTVFNSEINLIYCSIEGNTKKGDKEYTLEDLHPNYLEAVFGTDKREDIRKTIENTLSKFKGQVYFVNLSEQEQRDFRHALFDKKLRPKIMDLISHEGKMRVSGTQGYVARHIYKKLKEWETKNSHKIKINYFAESISSESVSLERKNLQGFYPELSKQVEDGQGQAAGSHVIDATIVWLRGLLDEIIPNWPQGMVLTPAYIFKLLPEKIEIIPLEARPEFRRSRPAHLPLFKSGMFAERFLSLIVGKEKVGFGFSLKEMIEIKLEDLETAFHLLKPVLLFHKKPIDSKKSLTDYQKFVKSRSSYVYFNIDRKKAFDIQKEIYHKENPTEEEIAFDNLLSSLAYQSTKTNNSVEIILADNKQNIELKDDNIQKYVVKKFKIVLPSKKQRPKKYSGILNLPYKEIWEKVLENPALKKLAKKKENWKNVEREELMELYQELFPTTVENPLRHKAVRKVYTLPLLANPSNGMRICRKSPFGELYQLQDKDGNSAIGFALEKGSINFNQPVLAPYLLSKNIVPLSRDFLKPTGVEFIYMDEWREIDPKLLNHKAVTRLLISPNSKPRAKVRIEILNEELGIIQNAKAFLYTVPVSDVLGANAGPNKLWARACENLNKLLRNELKFKPRDGKIRIFSVSQKALGLEFILEGTTKEVQELMQKGKPLKN